MHLIHRNWILILLKEIEHRQEDVIVLKPLTSQNRRPFSGPGLWAQLWQEKTGWPRRGLFFSSSSVWCGCVWAGTESSCLDTVLWVWLQTDGLMARSNKQSLDIRVRSLCSVKDEMQGPSLFMSQWLRSTSVWYWKECVVIQYCTSALPAEQGAHCLAVLCLSWHWLVGCQSTNKGMFARCRLLLETCSLVCLCLSMVLEIRSSFCSYQPQ